MLSMSLSKVFRSVVWHWGMRSVFFFSISMQKRENMGVDEIVNMVSRNCSESILKMSHFWRGVFILFVKNNNVSTLAI